MPKTIEKLTVLNCPVCGGTGSMRKTQARKNSMLTDWLYAGVLMFIGILLAVFIIGIPIFLYGFFYCSHEKVWLCSACGHKILRQK